MLKKNKKNNVLQVYLSILSVCGVQNWDLHELDFSLSKFQQFILVATFTLCH